MVGQVHGKKSFFVPQVWWLNCWGQYGCTDNINDYFDLLQDVFEKKGFADHPEAIYNMDKTGMLLELRPPKVVVQRGQKKSDTKHQGKNSK